MSLKQGFPFLILGVFAIGLLGFLWFTRERDDEKIKRVSLDYTRSKLEKDKVVEGRDFAVGTVEILSQGEDEAIVDVELKSINPKVRSKIVLAGHLYLLIRDKDGVWQVDSDMREHFAKAATDPAFVNKVSQRLLKTYQQRFRMNVKMKAGTKYYVNIKREKQDLIGTFEFRYTMARRDGKFDKGRYLERYRYKDGKWIQDGVGGIFEARAPK